MDEPFAITAGKNAAVLSCLVAEKSKRRRFFIGEEDAPVFREMRRHKQALTQEENIAVLQRNTAGVLAVLGDDGYPYAVPLSYVYREGKIYFHCAQSGHKLDAIARNPKVCFCVTDQDQIVPEEYTTYFRSVIAFGSACVLTDATQKRQALQWLAARYSPDHEQGRSVEIDRLFAQVCMVEITITHMTGKEAIELVRDR